MSKDARAAPSHVLQCIIYFLTAATPPKRKDTLRNLTSTQRRALRTPSSHQISLVQLPRPPPPPPSPSVSLRRGNPIS